MNPEGYISLKEAHSLLNIGYSTMQKIVSDGSVLVKREGNRTYVLEQDILAMKERQSQAKTNWIVRNGY